LLGHGGGLLAESSSASEAPGVGVIGHEHQGEEDCCERGCHREAVVLPSEEIFHVSLSWTMMEDGQQMGPAVQLRKS
jgi:hypothetical protein